ncbi:MAG: SEL1-like repeat protein [Prevotella sp.]|nr:SEL1-like repeat protein [Prevotella sp.]
MKQCPHCKSEILDDSLYCDRCGQHLMICADCGTYARGKFCPNCGGKHIIDPFEYEQRQKAAPEPETKPDPIPDASNQEKHTATLTSADGSITLHIDDSAEYIIGRKSAQFGRQLAGCARISRSHAAIKWDEEDGRWLLVDLHSTHGTRINQSKIDSDTYYYVDDGDTLCFANYEFYFADTGAQTESSVDYNDAESCKAAAARGDAKAMVNLGASYLYGLSGLEIDKAEAIKWLKKAVGLGETEAYYFLGTVYSDDEDPEYYDTDEAMKWYQKGAEEDDGDCMYCIGDLFEGEEDYDTAVQWYRKSMYAGSGYGCYRLAQMYHEGFGVEKDEDRCIKIMRKASELGESLADEWLEKNT